ncbi:hypothetical protein H310_00711 [Aphanomyces invadans]|uniref:Ammonium transporter AmtB-like domain-containing protein n=1 Tax=Aphanomyces invadans TaxID=157072 RepID=A0A024UXL5_9STRA|nr:hypothetical protein H310_00711 [Aphanomyces invadans]ETW10393.1 hypothetical protein H310_00711 [Aphanomyces invadans]|eukprot:XP_008861804.1 hypothetical protein H310_00711 [Aphanomyces invadans]
MAAPVIEFIDEEVDFSTIVRELLIASRQQSAPATATSLGILIWHVSFVIVLTMHVGYLVRHLMPRRRSNTCRRMSSTYVQIPLRRNEGAPNGMAHPVHSHLANVIPGSVLFAAFTTIYYGIKLHVSQTTAIMSILSHWSYSLTMIGVLTNAFASTHDVVGTIASLVGLAIVYPPVLWSTWLEEGWFNPRSSQPLFGVGAVDFGGSGVLHVVAGMMALVVSSALPATPQLCSIPITTSHTGYSFARTAALWLGTCGLLVNRINLVVPQLFHMAAMVACLVNTSLAFAGGGLVGFLIELFNSNSGTNSASVLHASCAAAMVAIRGIGPLAEPHVACIVGISAAIIVHFARQIKWLNAMEPSLGQATSVHLFGGMWGVCMGGLGGSPRSHDSMYGKPSFGLFYEHQGSGGIGAKQWSVNLFYLNCVIIWTASVSFVLVFVLRRCGLQQDLSKVAFDVDFSRDNGYTALLDEHEGGDVGGTPMEDRNLHYPVDHRRLSDIMGRLSSVQSSVVSGSESPSLEDLQERRRNSPFAWA